MEVSGVLSSCETVDMNSVFIRSISTSFEISLIDNTTPIIFPLESFKGEFIDPITIV